MSNRIVTDRSASGQSSARTVHHDTVSDLVDRVDLIALVESYAGTGRRTGDKWTGPCPNPSHEDRHPSFTVTRTTSGKQTARCWSACAWHGDAVDLIEWLDHVDTGEACRRLRDRVGIPTTPPRPRRAPTPPRPTRPTRTDPGDTRTPPPHVAARILTEHDTARGWPTGTAERLGTAERFGLAVIIDDYGRLRIRYPFHAFDGSEWIVSAWQDRAVNTDTRPKWLTPPGAVLPPFNVRSLDGRVVALVICEGPADAITAAVALEHRHDIGVIGVAGSKGWRPEWTPILGGRVVVLAPDPDDAGAAFAAALVDVAPAAVVVDLDADLTDTAREHGLEHVAALLTVPVAEALLGPLMGAPTETNDTPNDTPNGSTS